MASCNTSAVGRRKLFWATQPNACGEDQVCHEGCGRPGLSYDESDPAGRTISTDNWIVGLALNMLMTDGQEPNTACGYAPGGRGGHWSESYMSGSSTRVGTLMRTVAPQGRVQELLSLLIAHAESTMDRLVSRGVANKVTVTGKYSGNQKFQLDIEIFGVNNTVAKVGLSADRLANDWVWSF